MPSSTSGSPVYSSEVKNAKGSHKSALARAGNAESDSDDVIKPVHLRTFFSKYQSGRCLHECDPWAVLLHAAVLLISSCLLRFNELAALTTSHVGRSERHIRLSIFSAVQKILKKSVYELTPWPTAVRLDPRHDYICDCCVTSEGFAGLRVPWMSCFLSAISSWYLTLVLALSFQSHSRLAPNVLLFTAWTLCLRLQRGCVCEALLVAHFSA